MRYLLDTHAFLWAAVDDPELPRAARAIIIQPKNECFLSAASVWKMAIKLSLGKLALSLSLEQFVRHGLQNGIRLLDVTADHVYRVEHLPFHHRDPFDRVLVAQALHEGMVLMSRDEQIDAYAVPRTWA